MNAAGLEQLGLSDNTIQSIILFRNQGSRFNEPDDFRKMDGLTKADADILIPYIHIETVALKRAEPKTVLPKTETALPKPSFKKLDINTATSEEFKTLPGIGDVLSNRIIKFRNAIHGFKVVEDIGKTYGLPDSTYQRILPYLTIADSSKPEN